MPSNVLLYTLAVLGLAQFMAFAQEDTTVSLVIEPFEYQHSGYLWNVSNGLNYMYSTDSLFGDHALQLSVEQQGPTMSNSKGSSWIVRTDVARQNRFPSGTRH